MLQRFFYSIFMFLGQILQRPKLVFVICFIMVFMSLVGDGSLFQLWRLNKDQQVLEHKIEKMTFKTADVEKEILKASDPEYLARLAVQKFDLVKNGDLIFIFAE